MKVCSKCMVEKEESLFHKKKSGKNGLSSECKDCLYKRARVNIAKNREKHKEWQRNYRLKNKNRLAQYIKEYWSSSSTKEAHKLSVSKYRTINREKYLESSRRLAKKNTELLKPAYLKNHAIKSHNIPKNVIERCPELLLAIKEIIKFKRLYKSKTQQL